MNSRIENGLNGKYLYIETDKADEGFEYRMAASVASESIIAPTKVFAYGGICLEYCITGLRLFDEYLAGISLRSADIIRFLAQIEQCVRIVENYLLRADDLLINLKYLYVDEATGSLKICVVPGYEGNFEAEFKQLVNSLLMHIDADDVAALKLGHKLFKAVSSEDYKLQDVMAVLKTDSTGREALDGATIYAHRQGSAADNQYMNTVSTDTVYNGEYYNGSPSVDALRYAGQYTGQRQFDTAQPQGSAEQNYYGDDNLSNLSGRYDPQEGTEQADVQSGYDYDTEDETDNIGGRSILKETLTGLAVSQAILIGVAIAVYLLKGRATAMRLAPIYIIIAVCVTVYYVIGLFMKRRKV